MFRTISTSKKIAYAALATIVAVVLALSIALILQRDDSASAVKASDFNPGRIIDDAVFYNSGAMTANQIQTFLNAKNTQCDTNGSGRATDWGRPDITRATLASYIRNGTNGYSKNTSFHAPPYVCLKDFKQNTPQVGAASGLCEAIPARSNRTAAQIIDDVAKACGINSQVLLVLLEKEQSLVTDIWPLNLQYQRATGFACPDNAGGACDPSFNGFFRQVYAAGRQFKLYQSRPNDYNYRAGVTNNIFWQTNGGNFVSDGRAASRRNGQCGYSQVYIQNQATAALYIYTPYRPNQAALNNHPGTGDACSAYGNRNFWFMFNGWFGSTRGGITAGNIEFKSQPFSDKPMTVSFKITNTSKSSIDLGRIKIEAWSPTGNHYNFPSVDNISIKAGSSYTYTQTLTIPEEGQLTFNVARYHNGKWVFPPFGDYGYHNTTEVTARLAKAPTINTSLKFNKSTIHANEPVTATFTTKNNSATQSVDIGLLKVEAFDTDGKQYQFATNNDIALAPKSTHSYSSTASFSKTGPLTFEIVNRHPNIGWNKTHPMSDNPTIMRKVTVNIKEQATITEGLSIDKANIREGDSITATFKFRNFGTTPINTGPLKVEAFDDSGKQYQFGSTGYGQILAPGQEYAYEESLTLAKKGKYEFRIVNNHPKLGWNHSHPVSEDSGMTRSTKVSVKEQAEITSSLSITPLSFPAGSTATASFKIRNFGTKPVNIGRLKVEAFDDSGKQYQFGSTDNNLTLAPDQEYTYSQDLAINKRGAYIFRIVNKHPQLGWNNVLPQSQNSSIVRAQTITVK